MATQLSELSDQDLLSIAGVNLSDLSDEDLAKVAGVQLPPKGPEIKAAPEKTGLLEAIIRPALNRSTPASTRTIKDMIMGPDTAIGKALSGTGYGYDVPESQIPGHAPLVNLEATKTTPGLEQGVKQAVSGLTSPAMATTIAGAGVVGSVAPAIARLLSAKFGYDMVKATYEQSLQFKDAVDKGNVVEAERILGNLLVNAPMAGLAAYHAGKPGELGETPGEAVNRKMQGFRMPQDRVSEAPTTETAPAPEPPQPEAKAEEEPGIPPIVEPTKPAETAPPVQEMSDQQLMQIAGIKPEELTKPTEPTPVDVAKLPDKELLSIAGLKPEEVTKSEPATQAPTQPQLGARTASERIGTPEDQGAPETPSTQEYQDALAWANSLADQYGKAGLPTKERVIIREVDEQGKPYGQGLRYHEGVNIDDIPLLQDIQQFSADRIQTALKNRKGKVWDAIVEEAHRQILADKEANPETPGEAREPEGPVDTSFDFKEEPQEATVKNPPEKEARENTIRLYRGQPDENPIAWKEGADRFGMWFTTEPDLAKIYGENLHQVDVPRDVYESGLEAANEPDTGSWIKSGVLLPKEWAEKAQRVPRIETIADFSKQMAEAGRKEQGKAADELVGKMGDKILGGLKNAGDLEGSPLFPKEDKQGGLFGGGHADVGGYSDRSRKLIELPELVEFAKNLAKGAYPRVLEKLRLLKGTAAGAFYPRGEGRIDLAAGIFKYPEQAAKTVAHEIGHFVDYLPDKTMTRGNILGRIATLKNFLKGSIAIEPGGRGPLTPEERTQIRREAERMVKEGAKTEKEIDEVITRTTKFTPDEILEIFKHAAADRSFDPQLYEYIQRLDRAQKKQIVVEALKGRLAELRPPIPEKVETVATGRKIKVVEEATPEQIAEKYNQLIREAIAQRQLIERKVITEELKGITQKWKPFDERNDPNFTKYRYSSEELYADAVSVMMNEPDLLKKDAPNFYKAWLNYLERKPQVKNLYDEIQDRVGNRKDVGDARLQNISEMLDKGEASRRELNEQNRGKIEDIKDSVSRWLIDKEHAALKVIRGGEKSKEADVARSAKKARHQLEEMSYIASEAENYYRDIGDRILSPMKKAGIDEKDLNTYLFLRRIKGERTEIANPLGHTPETATDTLEALKSKIGPEKYDKIREMANEYQKIRDKLIIPELEKSKFFSKDLMEKIKDNKVYVRFSVRKFLEGAFGSGTTSRIYKQIGTLQEIESPLAATVLQDFSLLRAIRINDSKKSLIKTLQDAGQWDLPEMRYSKDVGGKVPMDPKDHSKAILTYMENGKPVHTVVSKAIAEGYERSPVEATKIAEIIGHLNTPIRDILVSKNPIWMARNVPRDLLATVKNIPEVKLSTLPALGRAYREGFKEAKAYALRGERSPDVEAMLKNRMLSSTRVYGKVEESTDTELEAIAKRFQMDLKENEETPGAKSLLKKIYDKAEAWGRVSEVTGKISGYKFLKEMGTRGEEEIGHVVRTRIGTPDYKRRGELQAITNNVFMFSNVNKEGLRSAIESFYEDKPAYIWKTVATNVLPKLLLYTAASGLVGQAVKKIVDAIPDYDKRMYSILPVGMKDGKAVYVRMPQDYEGQFWGAAAWELLHGKIAGKGGLVSSLAQQSPYSFHPLIKLGADLYDYYVQNLNPVDEFRGRNVIPDQVFKAGGLEAQKYMARHAWKSVGGSLIYNPSGPTVNVDETWVEKALKSFPLNVLGTFLKVSDQGVSEQLQDVREKAVQQTAAKSVEVQKRIQEKVNEDPTKQGARELYQELKEQGLISKGTTREEFTRRYMNRVGRFSGDPYMEAFSTASTTQEKKDILEYARLKLSPEEYESLKQKLKNKLISPKSLRQLEAPSKSP